ncbi:zinc-binding alcohol dehydrogenase family protein [Spirosoma montaniterrae]|uniref:Zn-dependent alcohol dehydrogenase n=1 Tax=Spirosoma montaniterrae TaxID=1178516 RepID=A0A1P9WV97_9BACT|nr:zinc-binding alcohol dehydrogenase family protein [Spirosoma montaniterrae]AQG79248.1 Zn-dependent alcohol dehydrogenase [Spirosoma montaniterrae]
MRALIISAPQTMTVGSWAMPQPGPGEVRVAVAAAGICAGDLYIYTGKNPYVAYPNIGGHEVSGYVEAVGPDVAELSIGDRVVVDPFVSCGRCYPCRIGKRNCCVNLRITGVHVPGGYADFVLTPATHAYKIPDGLSLEKAAFTEPVTVALHACQRAGVTAADDVLVLGCGPIGMVTIDVARAFGARVLAVDVLPQRVETAARLGADGMLSDGNLIKNVLERTNGEGMPVVIEATGVPAVMTQTLDLVAAGGRIVIVGLVGKGVAVPFQGLDFTRKEPTIYGSRTSTPDCFPTSMQLLAEGKIRFPDWATAFPMWEAPAVFADITAHPENVHKGLLIR